MAKLLSRNDVVVLCAFISPYRAMRDWVRSQVDNFIEVFVDCSLEVCMERDVKGMYSKAMRGEILDFTVISEVYEAPLNPDVIIDTNDTDPDECVAGLCFRLGFTRCYI